MLRPTSKQLRWTSNSHSVRLQAWRHDDSVMNPCERVLPQSLGMPINSRAEAAAFYLKHVKCLTDCEVMFFYFLFSFFLSGWIY